MAKWNIFNSSTNNAVAATNEVAERMFLEGLGMQANPPLVVDPYTTTQAMPRSWQRVGETIESESFRKRLIAMRLRMAEGDAFPYDHMHTVLAKETVFVFVVQNGQAVTLEDDPNLFPSDTLMTQLRLIAK